MTTQELNRDIKRLLKKEQSLRKLSNDEFYAAQPEIVNEIRRLYFADDTFKYLTKQSLLILLRLNLKYRAVALHQFGLMINI